MARSVAQLFVASLVVATLVGPAVADDSFKPRFPIRAFFRASELESLSVSPDGRFYATMVHLSSTREVRVYRRATSDYEVVVSTEDHKGIWFQWVGAETLVITAEKRNAAQWPNEVVRLTTEGEDLIASRRWIHSQGELVDPLLLSDGEVLFASDNAVYRFDVRKLADREYKRTFLDDEHQVASHPGEVMRWISDRSGEVRGVYTYERPDEEDSEDQGSYKVWTRATVADDWKEFITVSLEDEDRLIPLGFTDDGARVLAASNRGRDRFALVELDPDSAEEVATLYEHPSAELTGLALDYDTNSVVGVQYQEGGAHRVHYFSEELGNEHERIAQLLPGLEIHVNSRSRGRKILGVAAWSDQDVGGLYVYDAEANTIESVGRAMPWLDGIHFGRRHAFTVQAEGGPKVEAFYTEPSDSAGFRKPPLLVMPHGGPIGVRDESGYDPMLRVLSQYGYGILQVNYRGSSGYGRSFRDAGLGEFGSGIEDDIDAAFDYVIAQGWVDERRVAAIGASYGGYSSLMSALRHPTRFRAVVNLFGVTDLPRMLDDDYARISDKNRLERIAWVGDPDANYEDLLARSPAYRANSFECPILIIHGARDWSVDVDHAYRLRGMLDLHGKEYEYRIFKDLGHSFGDADTSTEILERVLGFLHKHVMSDVSFGRAWGPDALRREYQWRDNQ